MIEEFLDSCYSTHLVHNEAVFLFSRLLSLLTIGGLYLQKLPLTKQYGQEYGTVFTLLRWDSCVLNPLPTFLMN